MGKFSFGIDLGTTNSCIAVMQGATREMQQPRIVKLANGEETLPSCVWYKRDGSVVVGREAYENRHLVQEVVYSSKRDIGTGKVYKLHEGKLTVTPVDVASEVLKKLKADTEIMYGKGAVDEAVITVPAYFDSNKRKATCEAAERAGIHVKALINEPTSAALSYAFNHTEDECFLVYDLGGGTFDVTLMEVRAQKNSEEDEFDFFSDMSTNKPSQVLAQVLASAGDDHLGGDDLDISLYKNSLARANKEFQGVHNLASFNLESQINEETRQKLLLFAEQFKKQFSNQLCVWDLPVTVYDQKEMAHLYFNQEVINESLAPLFKKTLNKVDECLRAAFRTRQDVKKIILVGGSTKLSHLQNLIKTTFSHADVFCEVNPDEAVALGAAVHMGILKGDSDMIVSDVLPQSIGVDCVMTMNGLEIEGRFKRVLAKDTVLPAVATVEMTTVADNQTFLPVAIYQGESYNSDDNTYLGTVVLDDVELAKKGEDSVRLTMCVDGNGILSVQVLAKGKKKEVVLENVLNPVESTKRSPEDSLIDNMIASLKADKDMDNEVREKYLAQLEECRTNPSQLPVVRAEMRKELAKHSNRIRDGITNHFSADMSSLRAGGQLDGFDEDETEDEVE